MTRWFVAVLAGCALLTGTAQAASEIHVDFQPATAEVAPGYVAVDNTCRWDQNKTVNLGSGVLGAWTDWFNGSVTARATTYTNPLTRDFAVFGNETFKMTGVAPGNYLLTLYAVDPAYKDKKTRFEIDQDADSVTDVTVTIDATAAGNESSKTVGVVVSAASILSIKITTFGTAGVCNGFDLVQGPPDTVAPAAINTLAVTGQNATQVMLRWTAPADTNSGVTVPVSSYDVRYSTEAITDGTWDAAVQATGEPAALSPGQTQTFTVSDLSPATTYHFAARSIDGNNNVSPLSNVASATTDPPDVTAPAAIADLRLASNGVYKVTIAWTATGDDADTGNATRYEIRYSTNPITDEATFTAGHAVTNPPTPKAAGSAESLLVTGLQSQTNYWFAIKAIDEAGNAALSNVLPITTLPPGEPFHGVSNGLSLDASPAGPYEPAIPVTADISITNINADRAKIARTIQRSGPVYTGEIAYDLAAGEPYVHVWLELSTDNGATWSERRIHAVGAVGTIQPGTGKFARWLVDGDHGHACRIRIRATDTPATYSDFDADNNKMPRPVPWVHYPLLERLTDKKDFNFADSRCELPKIDFYKSLAAGRAKVGFARVPYFHGGATPPANPMTFLHCMYVESADSVQKYVILTADNILIETDQFDTWRDQIQAAFGIPEEHVMVMYTHYHVYGAVGDFPNGLLQQAMNNVRPAEIAFVNHDMGTSYMTNRNLLTSPTAATSSFTNGTDLSPIWQFDPLGNIIGGVLDGRFYASPVQQYFDCPLDSYLQMIVCRDADTKQLTGVMVKLTGHPVARDWPGDMPKCVMDKMQAKFGSNVEILYTIGYGSNHRPLAAQGYPAELGSPRVANAITKVLEDALPTLEFQPLTRIGTATGYDQFASHAGSADMNGTDPDRLGAQIQVLGFNDIYLSAVPGEASSQQGLYVRARTHDTRHMYNGYGNAWFMYFAFGRWYNIGHYENQARLATQFESFRMAQEIVRGVNIMEQSLASIRIPGDIDGDNHVDVLDLLSLAGSWNLSAGDPSFDAACDLNGDASVDVIDLLLLADNWGL